jgi:hypothetical protein
MATTPRLGLRARALVGLGAALLASPAAFGSVMVGHAASTWTCAAQVAWTTNGGLGSSTLSGQTMFVGAQTCVVSTLSPVVTKAGYSVGYTYSGNCAEGTLAFSNGTIGVFVGGILVAEQQSSAGVGTLVAAGVALGGPCGGGISYWGGDGVEAGG